MKSIFHSMYTFNVVAVLAIYNMAQVLSHSQNVYNGNKTLFPATHVLQKEIS